MPTARSISNLTRTQTSALIVLVDEGRELDNKEIKERGGPALDGTNSKELEELGLVETNRSRRIHSHRLTEKGRQVALGLKASESHRKSSQKSPRKTSQKSPRTTSQPPPPLAPAVDLTTGQIQALVVLMAEARELTNEEFRRLAGSALTGKDNEKLNKLGLVDTDRTQRPYSHELTDKGWRLLRELPATLPPRGGGSAIQSLFTLLRNVYRAMDRLPISPAEFFKQATEAIVYEPPMMAPNDDVEERIRSAYEALPKSADGWVGLADLRDHLRDLDRAAVDTTLRAMARQPGVRIIPVANSKSLQPRDRVAALRLGDEDNHVLWIGVS